uniref:Uncharacterized protein n=1 Tax=Nelumbo nucifera TaxID=4432 RepID=A0A822XVL3_NELNU|nr:TPA_asm: hypothetical protein HUJ06_024288 [Nelumbo nucifera]
MMHERKQRGGGSGHGRDDRFGDRDERWRPPPRSYEYEYGEFKDEPGYGNYGREERKPVTPLRDMKPERVLGRMHQLQRLLDRDDDASAEDRSNRLALALFSGEPNGNANNSWEAFPSDGGHLDSLK